jgi:hypothetical protein
VPLVADQHVRRLLKPSNSLERVAALALGTMALILSVATFRMAFRSLSPLPLFDDWGFLEPPSTLQGLFALKSEHRIVLSQLVFLADARLLNGRHVLEFVVNALMLLSLGAAYWAAVKLDLRSTPIHALLAAAIALCFAVSPLTLGVLVWAMHVQNVGINVCALFAFLSLAKSARTRPVGGLAYYVLLAAAMFLGAFASLVSAPGILVSILLIPQAALMGMRRRVVAVLGVVAVASTWYYLHGNSAQGNLIATLMSAPLLVCKFLLAFLGSFITMMLRQSDTVAYPALTMCFGAVSLVVLAINVSLFVGKYRTEQGNGFPDFALFTLTAAAFFLMSAGLVAGGRTTFGMATAYTEHYNMLRALYWANLLISVAACWNAVRVWTFVSTIALCAAIAFAASIPIRNIGLAYRNAALNRAGAAVASEVYDIPAWQPLNIWNRSNPEVLPFQQRQVALLRRTGQSVFYAAPAVWLGRQIGDLPMLDHSCAGSILTARSGTDPKGTYVIVSGWVRAAIGTDKLPQIILADKLGVVSGFGAVGANKIGNADWIGYARLPSAPTDAYILQAGGLCRLVAE